MRNRRLSPGVAVVAAAVLGVALTVVGASVLRDGGPATRADGPSAVPGRPPTGEPTVLGEELLGLDRGTLGEAEALRSCASPRFAGEGPVEVLYGVRQVVADSEGPVVALRNADGELRLCDARGPDSPSQAPLPEVGASAPVAFLNAGASWECTGDRLDRYTSATWLLVDDRVAGVRQRLWVDGDPGPWFTTEAVNGLVHVAAWVEGPLPAGTDLATQFELLDAAGEPVPQDMLPTTPAEVGWCADGDVQIG